MLLISLSIQIDKLHPTHKLAHMGELLGDESNRLGAEKPGFYKRIFNHPNFNVVSSLIGIGGVLFAVITVFFPITSFQTPKLSYCISLTRTAIVQKGNLEHCAVTFWGKQVDGDLSAAEVQIWNAGKTSILGTDVLQGGDVEKRVVLKTAHGEPIYQVTAAQNRDIVGVDMLGITNHISGEFPFAWKILEPGDGIKIQIIYGGNVNMPFILEGAIKGQREIVSMMSVSTPIGWTIYLVLFLFPPAIFLRGVTMYRNSGKAFDHGLLRIIPHTIILLNTALVLAWLYVIWTIATKIESPFNSYF